MLPIMSLAVSNARFIRPDASIKDARLASVNIAITDRPERTISPARLKVMWLTQFETLYVLGPITTLKAARLIILLHYLSHLLSHTGE